MASYSVSAEGKETLENIREELEATFDVELTQEDLVLLMTYTAAAGPTIRTHRARTDCENEVGLDPLATTDDGQTVQEIVWDGVNGRL